VRIFLEIVQGEVGVHPIPVEMLQLARELADRHGALLVIDEIQTGLSRTGALFAYQDVGITPDVMTLAKSLGGGVPIGAVTARPGIDATFVPGDHGSTFAGGPLACAAGIASCQVLADPVLQASVRVKGRALLEALQRLVDDGLATEARGRGLMCAVDLPEARAADVTGAMLQEGYLVNNTSSRTLRFLPPLVIEDEDLAGLVTSLRAVLTA
jgi:acetylornithine/N-succinyldiaminopimelate aminotransferase